ncbi:MAG: hypothetical protein AAF916_10190 [Planctomycetota bacterium]
MGDLPLWAWVLVSVGGFWLLISAVGFLPGVLLRFSSFAPVDDGRDVVERAMGAVGHEWFAGSGFEARGAVRPLGIPIALFRHAGGQTCLAVYFAGDKPVIDFVTAFPNHVGVTTSSTIDGVTVPNSSGALNESFPHATIDELWAAHRESLEVLRGHLGVGPEPIGEVHEAMRDAVARQIGGALARPWRILTIPYRYGVLRFTRRNVSVAAQIDRGIVDVDALVNQATGRDGMY